MRSYLVLVLLSAIVLSVACWTGAQGQGPAPTESKQVDNTRNEELIRRMRGVVESNLRLDRDQAAAMGDAIRMELSRHSDLGPDKLNHAREHLQQLLDDSILGLVADAQGRHFTPVLEYFNWHLKNYANMPALTSEQRVALQHLRERLVAEAKAAATTAYADIPGEVREQLIESIERDFAPDTLGAVGNYFYPEKLYLVPEDKRPDVKTLLLQHAVMSGVADRWESIKGTLDDPTFGGSPQVRRSVVDAYVQHEQGSIWTAFQPIARQMFAMTPEATRAYRILPGWIHKQLLEIMQRQQLRLRAERQRGYDPQEVANGITDPAEPKIIEADPEPAQP